MFADLDLFVANKKIANRFYWGGQGSRTAFTPLGVTSPVSSNDRESTGATSAVRPQLQTITYHSHLITPHESD